MRGPGAVAAASKNVHRSLEVELAIDGVKANQNAETVALQVLVLGMLIPLTAVPSDLIVAYTGGTLARRIAGKTAGTHLVELIPQNRDCAVERDEFNRIIDNEFLRVRDFLILHYHATERSDSDFWNHVRTMPIPDSLQEKINLFKARGRVSKYQQGLFLEPSWLAVYLGQRVLPDAWDQRVDLAPAAELKEQLHSTRDEIARAVASMAEHRDFIEQHTRGQEAVTP